jgi:hypothetical protein
VSPPGSPEGTTQPGIAPVPDAHTYVAEDGQDDLCIRGVSPVLVPRPGDVSSSSCSLGVTGLSASSTRVRFRVRADCTELANGTPLVRAHILHLSVFGDQNPQPLVVSTTADSPPSSPKDGTDSINDGARLTTNQLSSSPMILEADLDVPPPLDSNDEDEGDDDDELLVDKLTLGLTGTASGLLPTGTLTWTRLRRGDGGANSRSQRARDRRAQHAQHAESDTASRRDEDRVRLFDLVKSTIPKAPVDLARSEVGASSAASDPRGPPPVDDGLGRFSEHVSRHAKGQCGVCGILIAALDKKITDPDGAMFHAACYESRRKARSSTSAASAQRAPKLHGIPARKGSAAHGEVRIDALFAELQAARGALRPSSVNSIRLLSHGVVDPEPEWVRPLPGDDGPAEVTAVASSDVAVAAMVDGAVPTLADVRAREEATFERDSAARVSTPHVGSSPSPHTTPTPVVATDAELDALTERVRTCTASRDSVGAAAVVGATTAALKTRPNNARALRLRAAALQLCDRHADARADLMQACETVPTVADCTALAYFFHSQGQHAEAIARWSTLVSVDMTVSHGYILCPFVLDPFM